jgi:hypothetical protein
MSGLRAGSEQRSPPKRESTVHLVTQQDTRFEDEGPAKRFHIELFIVHPTLDPTEISTALGLEAHFAQRVGDPRKTPQGRPLAGNYKETRWRHCIERSTKDQWFAAEVTSLLDRLEPHKAFFAYLRQTGGQASLIVQFLGDGYLSDEIPHVALVKLVELGLGLGIESFVDPQS